MEVLKNQPPTADGCKQSELPGNPLQEQVRIDHRAEQKASVRRKIRITQHTQSDAYPYDGNAVGAALQYDIEDERQGIFIPSGRSRQRLF